MTNLTTFKLRPLIATLMAGAFWMSPALATQLSVECESAYSAPYVYAVIFVDTDAKTVSVVDNLTSLHDATPDKVRTYPIKHIQTSPQATVDKFGNVTGFEQVFYGVSWIDTSDGWVASLWPDRGGYLYNANRANQYFAYRCVEK